MNNTLEVGITSYGWYVPSSRVTTEVLAANNGKKASDIVASLNIEAKAVASRDEDVLTMSFEAASMACLPGQGAMQVINKKDFDFVAVGSETHPYAVKPTSVMVAEWLNLGANNEYQAFDTQFACKAGSAALMTGFSSVLAGTSKQGLIIGADRSTGKPGDALEYSAAAGAAAFVISANNPGLKLITMLSKTSDTPDFWRRHGQMYPTHAGRFTAGPGYFTHVLGAVKAVLEKAKMQPSDFAYACFHMPNGRFPREAGKKLGFSPEQLQPSLVVGKLGNSYAASSFMGLVATIEHTKPGDYVLYCSYGSGSGSDAFIFQATNSVENMKKNFIPSHAPHEISYAQYQLQTTKAV